MSVVDSTDNTATNSSVTIASVETVANVDPITDPQSQPRVLARQIPSSTARGQMQLGAPNIFTDSGNQRIMVQDDSQVNVVELGDIGINGDGTKIWGMKVAQPGIDVTTATDSQLIFNSQQDIFKIVQEGTVTLTIPNAHGGQSAQSTIAHGLGFTPAVVGFVVSVGSASGFSVPLPYNDWGFTTDGAGVTTLYTSTQVQIYVDATSIFTRVLAGDPDTGGTSGDWIIKYYLLQESLTAGGNEGGSIL